MNTINTMQQTVRTSLVLAFCLLAGISKSLSAQCTVTVVSAPACSANIGTAFASASNGVLPYAYAWSNGANTPFIQQLAPGVYTVTVTDGAGCTATNTAEILDGSPPTASISGPGTACVGQTVILNATGGGTYAWSTGATTAGLMATISFTSTYFVTVSNAQGCTATASATVVALQRPTANINAPTTHCLGASTVLNAATNTGTSFIWNTGATVQNITVDPLVSTTYTVTITNAQGCTRSDTHTLSVVPNVSAQISGNAPICNQGPIELSAENGGNLTFNWSNGASTQAISVNPAVSTPYTVTVTNTFGCSATATEIVSPVVNAETEVNNLDCSEGSPGNIVALPGGGQTPYQFLWSNGATTASLENVPAGTYTVTITDQNNCFQVVSDEVGAALNLSGVVNAPACVLFNAAIDLTVVGGAQPYVYAWNTGATMQDISGLETGVYTVSVTDAAGCTATAQWNVASTEIVTLQTNSTPATCNLPNGSASVQITSGQQIAMYLWSNGVTTATIQGLGPGTYTTTVTVASGCTANASVTVLALNAPTVAYNFSTPTCALGGVLDVLAAGGTPPYSYLWSTGATTQTLFDLAPGLYTVTVTDAAGCSGITTLTLEGPPPIVLNVSSVNAACGQNNGSAAATPTGGLPPYQFLWSTGASTDTITGLAQGNYTVTVTDANQCSAVATVTVSATADFSFSFITTNASCAAASDGAVQLLLVGGIGPFAFAWSNGATTQDISGLGAGLYQVTVTDLSAGCTSVLPPALVTAPAEIALDFLVVHPRCFGASDGAITVNASGGSGAFAILWPFSCSNCNPTAFDLSAGVYTVTVTDLVNGCTQIETITLTEPPLLTATPSITQECGLTTVSLFSIQGGSPPYTILWSNGAGTPVLVADVSGAYQATITDANGCTQTIEVDVEVIPNYLCATLTGQVYCDDNYNCALDAGEPNLAGWIVRATGPSQTFYAITDASGVYHLRVPPALDYSLVAIPTGSPWLPCPPVALTAPATLDTLEGVHLGVQKETYCPELEVSMASGNMRRCFSNNYYVVQYCNLGTAPAEDAYVILTVDPFVTLLTTSMPAIALGNQMYRFNVGTVAAGECKQFSATFLISCDAVTGQSICSEAHIYPDSSCQTPSALWSGASLELSAVCAADSLRFEISNKGYGNMSETLDYIVIEDHVMLMRQGVQLAPGVSRTVAVPSNGSTWTLSIPQEPFHPGQSQPLLSVEGCTSGGQFSTGFVAQFAQNEQDPWIDIECKEVTAAFDPNDKQGFPRGYGEQRYIAPGTALEYLIRFQNTGNDTAFTVRIVDTLSQWFNPATIRPGASSHPYQMRLYGEGIAEFVFENIMLPDSNVNEPASHGFVKFSILHDEDAPLETVLENSVGIYFDFNEPIITNTTLHRLGLNFITVGLWDPVLSRYELQAYPNPANAWTRIEVNVPQRALRLQVSDERGRIVLEQEIFGNRFEFDAASWAPGAYFFSISEKEGLLGTGKLIKQR